MRGSKKVSQPRRCPRAQKVGNMSTHAVTPSPNDFLQQQSYWDAILRDAGLPPEPRPLPNTFPLSKDPSADFLGVQEFFDRNAEAIFEAKQQWKQVGPIRLFCRMCGVEFWDRAGTLYCCDTHRKRNWEGKEVCDDCGAFFIPPDNKTWKIVRTVAGHFGTTGGLKLCSKCEKTNHE